MEETLDLKEIFYILKKRIWLIALCTIIPLIVTGVVSFYYLTPVYEQSTQILINQAKSKEDLYDWNEVETNLQLINTYNVIIKSPVILDKVVSNLNLSINGDELNSKVSVFNEKDSQVVTISVDDGDGKLAGIIANEIASVFKAELPNIMSVDNVTVLSEANIEDDGFQIYPNKKMNLAIALVIGAFLGLGVAFLLEYLDGSIKTVSDLERSFNVPILGIVADMNEIKSLKKHRKSKKREKNFAGVGA